jgi:tetratricopeptide (TPR) repeat protein
MSEASDPLLRWAQAVVDGEPVDWQEASRSGEVSASQLKRLEILAAIAGACGMPSIAPRPSAELLFRWCHLEIRERIGEGVFGQVHRAWDTKLEREVAVKFLRSDATPVAAHALQEGRHLARVRHPGVVMVFGAEEMDGRVGIWMEHIRGHTLEDLLEARGAFSSQEAILIGIDLCRALGAVHRAGLVHRDVKTRNVVREDTGRIVLMDFGAGAEAKSEGESHGLAGTPIYLAPEVLEGRSATPQSDLYGLGVLLYRLVTRNYPIGGATLDGLRAAHARGEMRPLSEARPDLPSPFARLVERALAAEPARRYVNAEQMEGALVAALDAPRRSARRRAGVAAVAAVALIALGSTLAVQRTRTASPGTSSSRSVAVADVVNQVHDPELDALAGMLVTSLEQARGLLVLTHSQMTDILSVAGKDAGARIDEALGLEIGRRAGATAVLVPSVRKIGEQYEVALDAIDPQRGRRLFSATAVAANKDRLPAAIDTLSQRVRNTLERGPEASHDAMLPVAQITTASLGAYHHYDQAERRIDQLQIPEARSELERAVVIDSTFGLAHARLAYVYWWQSNQEGERAELAKAFALIDRIPERYRYHLRAQGAMADREGLEAARAILLEMERFYPQDKEMLYDIGDYSSHLNEFPTAIQYLEKVVAMDPDFVRALQHLARVYRDMDRRGPFLEWARRYAAADSGGDANGLLADAMAVTGDTANAITTLERGRALQPQRAQEYTYLIARVRFLQGHWEEGLSEWASLLDTASTPSVRGSVLHERAIGRIHQGTYREALADLERAATLLHRSHATVEEAMARLDAANLYIVGMNDSLAAFRQLRRCATLEGAITYRDSYFQYWPYWGGLFKLHLLNGDLAAATTLARQKFAADKWYGSYVAAYLHAARGKCAQASAAASRVLEWGPAIENIPLLYYIARCQLEQGEADEAVQSLLHLQTLYSHLTLGTPYYAKSLLLLGEAYERKGDSASAARSYSKLLDVWRDGDRDLADRLEASQRLAKLEPALASARRLN